MKYRLLGLLALSTACGDSTVTSREGLVPLPTAQLYYRIVGDGPGTPLLVLHGGPGGRSCDLATLEAIGRDRPIVFYDQRGSGRSSIATDQASWNIGQFAADLDSLRRALGLDSLHLYGHSWGGALAVEYLLTHGSEGVASLTLAAPLVSTPRWMHIADSLLGTMPGGARDVARDFEARDQTDAAAYDQVKERFHRTFGRRNTPPYEVGARCAVGGEANWQVYQYLWGASEFHATGTLKDFDRFDQLPSIAVPTLVIVGEHDAVPPGEADAIARQLPRAQVVVIAGAGHMAMQDNPADYIAALRRFLNETDAP